MYWELWDTEVGALVETFPSEAEALRGVREILAVNSPDLVNALVLGAMYDEEEPRDRELPPVLGGKELLSYLATTPESPVVTAAALVVHERIRQWLAEENWDVRKVDDPQSSFNVMATLPSGPNVNIFQYKHHVDHLTFSQHWLYDDGFRSAISHLPAETLRNVVWNIYRDVSIMGVEFSGLDTPSTEMTLRTYVYFDGLTKNEFVQKVLLTIRALSLAVRTFIRALEEQSRSEELDPSSAIRAFIRTLEEDSSTEETTPSSSQLVLSSENRTLSRDEVKELMRRVPQTYGSLTMAS